jgi:hypothetical protein
VPLAAAEELALVDAELEPPPHAVSVPAAASDTNSTTEATRRLGGKCRVIEELPFRIWTISC